MANTKNQGDLNHGDGDSKPAARGSIRRGDDPPPVNVELKPILRLNFSKITDVFRPRLRPLLKKLLSKRRFNSRVEDQMFDLFGKLWPNFALNRLLFWQINCRQGPICRALEPCMGYLLSSVYLLLHAEVLWCVSVLFLNGTSTFICKKIVYFNVVFASSFGIRITKYLIQNSLFW